MMSGLPMLKRPRIESSTSVLTAVEVCSKEVKNLKLAFNQRLLNLENHMNMFSTGCNTIIQRMDSLETFIRNCMKSDNSRHSCCEEVLRKLARMEELVTSLTQQNAIIKEENSNANMSGSPVVLVRNNKPAQVSVDRDDDPLSSLDCNDQTLTIVTSTGEVSVDVASIASDHGQLVEAQDIHIEGAQVLEMGDDGELGVVEASDRITEEGEFIEID
ncbi:hypothetical protein C0J52_03643 [Blattella germanica]|nr:hypothetical protein C0J52_03643 [Blattella germanica]